MDEYQEKTNETAIYPDMNWMEYLSTGMAGEVGELCSKVAKSFRKDKGIDPEELMLELGDIMWYFIQACIALDITPEEVIEMNV